MRLLPPSPLRSISVLTQPAYHGAFYPAAIIQHVLRSMVSRRGMAPRLVLDHHRSWPSAHASLTRPRHEEPSALSRARRRARPDHVDRKTRPHPAARRGPDGIAQRRDSVASTPRRGSRSRCACPVFGQGTQDALHPASPRRGRDPRVVARRASRRSGRPHLPKLERQLLERRRAPAARYPARRDCQHDLLFARGPLDHAPHATPYHRDDPFARRSRSNRDRTLAWPGLATSPPRPRRSTSTPWCPTITSGPCSSFVPVVSEY